MSSANANPVWGFGRGLLAGIVLAGIALLINSRTMQSLANQTSIAPPQATEALTWMTTNLGHSVWLFAAVVILFTAKLWRLHRLLAKTPLPLDQSDSIVALDQILDVWVQVFIGIGVVWTAVGMRAALQAALADPDGALTDTAGNVLQKLVDGGILLALTTTIVGAVGGYIMRVIKTLSVGRTLQTFYETLERREMRLLLETAGRIESQLAALRQPVPNVAHFPEKVLQ